MKFSEEQINDLRHAVGRKQSKKRFAHTLGVEKMAAFIGEKIMPESVDKLRVAALLHDVSKEYSEAEYFLVVKKHNIILTDEDMASPALWHSITAPAVVNDEFPEYADKDILSAVYNHTVGSPDMSHFDEIILLSDYIEEGRKYRACTDLRERFLAEISDSEDREDCITALHRAVASALNNTINELVSRGKSYHERTRTTLDAILAKIER